MTEPLAVAKILKGVVAAEQPGLVILGKQAIDDDSNQTGPDAGRADRLGPGNLRLQGRSSATARSTVTREVDGGMQTVA